MSLVELDFIVIGGIILAVSNENRADCGLYAVSYAGGLVIC